MASERETYDVAGAAIRMILAVGARIAEEDPAELTYLAALENAVGRARRLAVNGLRERGATDVQIGEALGMSRQAVQQRWPRLTVVTGAGARFVRR